MCYTVAYLTKRKIRYARRAGADPSEVEELERQLEEMAEGHPAMYHASGFTHPRLLCFARDQGPRFELCRWGLIPHWVKDAAEAVSIGRRTLNARGETIFTKPAFRTAALRRCLILVDGFYEFHHLGKRTFPYHIRARDQEPLALAGIRSDWHDTQAGTVVPTVSIVTTEANPMMRVIHNNPKASGPRMPFVVPPELDELWLDPETERERIEGIIGPYDEALLEAYTVPPLLGKQAVGNVESATQPFTYPELSSLL